MVESNPTTANDLRSAIRVALAAGVVTRDEILDMVSTDGPDAGSNGHVPAELMRDADDLPIYTELPEGLIDLPSASDAYGKSRQLLFQWVTQGRLPERGLFKPPGRTVANVVVSERELETCIDGTDGWVDRPKGWRVKNNLLGPDELPDGIFSEVPEGLIDLPSAASKFGCSLGRLHSWITRGHLQVHGRLRAPARGGGYRLVSEEEVIQLMRMPPNKGGRPTNRSRPKTK